MAGSRAKYIGVDEYIIRNLGHFPIISMELHKKVQDDYGYIHPRLFYRSLKRLVEEKKIQRVIHEMNDEHNLQDCNGFFLPLRKRNPCVFQRRYINILNYKTMRYSHLGRMSN